MPSQLQLHKTSSLDQDKKCNVYCHLLAKEYNVASSHRRVHHVMGTLITRGSYQLRRSWSKFSKKHIGCDGKYAFFDNYKQCFDCTKHNVGEQFTLSLARQHKIEDVLLVEGLPESVDLRHHGHKGSLYAVTNQNMLLRLDINSGKSLEKVYLSSDLIKYRRIQWNVTDESFTLYSKVFPQQSQHDRRQSANEPTNVIQLILMSCLPLEFICKFTVTRQIFGQDVTDAYVFLDILMVMHSSNCVRMYSLQTLMEQGRRDHQKLYDQLQDGSSYGVHPSPLTVNVAITERPPCLFDVRAQNKDVMMTMPPCHYVMWPYSEGSGYCCYSFITRQQVENGCLGMEATSMDERVSLHADDSGRIIHMKNSELRVLKLEPCPNSDERRLVEDFVIHFSSEHESPATRVSQFGRIIKRVVRPDCRTILDKTVLCMTYSDDLDMMIILSIAKNQGSEADMPFTVIGFYDNCNGSLLRQFPLEETVEDSLECSVAFSSDTLTHVFKSYSGKFECHVYKLVALIDFVADKMEGRHVRGGSHTE